MRKGQREACRNWRRRPFNVPRSLFAYIVCAARKSTGRVVFFAPRREKPNARYLQRTSLPVVCRRFSTPFRAAHLLENMPGAFRARRGAVIFDDLRAIQLRYGFLPKAELEGLSQRTQTPLYQIHSVASFYPHFHLVPPAKAEIRVCADMSCHLNGACELRADLERRFASSQPEEAQFRSTTTFSRMSPLRMPSKSHAAPCAARTFTKRIPSRHASGAKPIPTATGRSTALFANLFNRVLGTMSWHYSKPPN